MWTVDQPVQGFTICAWTNSDNDPTDQTPVSLDKGAWADYGTDNGASITYASGGGGNWQAHAGGIQENSGTNTELDGESVAREEYDWHREQKDKDKQIQDRMITNEIKYERVVK